MDDFASDDERALDERAHSAPPSLRARLGRLWDEPLRHLEFSIDQDTWPEPDDAVLELELAAEPGAVRLLLAPYVEGATWPASCGLEERPAGDFLGRTKPRIDARLLWGGTERVLTAHIDGSELGEEPLVLALKVEDVEAPAETDEPSRAHRHELPSLGRCVENGAKITRVRCARAGELSRSEPPAKELELRLCAKLAHEDVTSVTLWQSHERPLRAALRARARRDRIAVALETGGPIAAEDRFAAARMLGYRGDVLALRRQSLRAADAFNGAASLLLDGFEFGAASYAQFFELWRYACRALGLLARAGHDDAFSHYAATAVRVSRAMQHAHPAEPDYARALALALLLRAEAVDARSGGLDDAALEEAAALFEELARNKALPWRESEASRTRVRAEALYRRHHAVRSDRLSSLPPRPR